MTEVVKYASQVYFQNSLAEVVRKLRNPASSSEEEVIEQFISDTKKEVGSTIQSVKVAAVQKATYFHMIGYSASYASFHVIELMADTLFAYKRIGYVAACNTFTESTDVIPLMTALLKRDLNSGNQYESGLALYCIASICTPDLAKDLAADVVRLLSHPRTYVRKKAVLSLYKIFFQYPESLRPTYPLLKEKLEDKSERCDTDPAVRGAVVCVLCELARRNPANYLGLAVPFYSLLSSVHSNWTLIKVIKVFGYFAPLEPRLGKKLVEPLTNLILNSSAKSVQYECLLAVASGMSKAADLTKMALDKLTLFIEDSDQNLKFLGLDAVSRIVSDSPKLCAPLRHTILACLDDADATIRHKTLVILRDLVTRKTIISTINSMCDRCIRATPEDDWSNAVVEAIIDTARTSDYALVEDFEWYMGVLLDLCVADIATFSHGTLLENELVEMMTRVPGVRQCGVEWLSQLLTNERLLKCDAQSSSQWRVLCAAAFACGEYPQWLVDKRHTCDHLLGEGIALLPAEVQLACLTAVSKVSAYVHDPCTRHVELCGGEEDCELPGGPDSLVPVSFAELKEALLPARTAADAAADKPFTMLSRFMHSVQPDVQERATFVHHQLLECPQLGTTLYARSLQPVAAGAQEALEVPEGLSLSTPFCGDMATALAALATSDDDDGDRGSANGDRNLSDNDFGLEYMVEQQRRRDQQRKVEVSPFYIAGDASLTGAAVAASAAGGNATKTIMILEDKGHTRPGSHRADHSGAGKRRRQYVMNRDLSKPESYSEAAALEKARRRSSSPAEDEVARRLRHIDVTRALAPDEVLHEVAPYSNQLATQLKSSPVSRGLGGARGTAAATETPLPAVQLHDSDCVRVRVTVEDCRVRRSGVQLRCLVELYNTATSSTMHGAELRVAVPLTDTGIGEGTACVFLDDKNGSGAADNGATTAEAEGGEQRGALLASRVKSGGVSRTSVILQLPTLPSSLATPLTLTLTFTRDRKAQTLSLALPLQYTYFAKPVRHALITAEELMAKVLPHDLAGTSVHSTFVACQRAEILLAVPLVQQQLRLSAVSILKDTMSLHGAVHSRKSEPERTHVAVLLREVAEGGEKGLAVSVRAHETALATSLLEAVVSIVHSTAK